MTRKQKKTLARETPKKSEGDGCGPGTPRGHEITPTNKYQHHPQKRAHQQGTNPLTHPNPALGLNQKAGVQPAPKQNTDNDHNSTKPGNSF